MVHWCLNLKLLSPSAYSPLRSSGLLKLPSDRTLRDYTHLVKAKPGFQPEVDLQLQEEAFSAQLGGNSDTSHLKSYVTLVFDEVKVQEGLVYDKESCNLIGFVQLDDLSSHISSLTGDQQQPSNVPDIATHILVFMVRGLFSLLEFPYDQFPTSSLSGGILYPLVWECIAHLEMIGFKVLTVTADGTSPNRKFVKLNSNGLKAIFTNKTTNIYSQESSRPLFFFSDIPHLIKTVRNNWANSGSHTYTQDLEVCTMILHCDDELLYTIPYYR